ncbi:MAG: hypothetical protein QXH71_03970 [Candidatus Anstonellaceae archaeon]
MKFAALNRFKNFSVYYLTKKEVFAMIVDEDEEEFDEEEEDYDDSFDEDEDEEEFDEDWDEE